MTNTDSVHAPPSTALAQPAVTEHGGRVELRLNVAATNSERVVYDARWMYEAKVVTGQAMISAAAASPAVANSAGSTPSPLVISIDPISLPSWLLSFSTALLRTTARTVLAETTDFSGASWPRRLTRWRKSP